MDSSKVRALVESELARGEPFSNFHGITPDNVRSFLVEPFIIRTDPDDLETLPRDMWVVLQECGAPTEGYVVVYDPLKQTWGVAEHVRGADYILIAGASSLAEALEGM
jgi:hypothetical protein